MKNSHLKITLNILKMKKQLVKNFVKNGKKFVAPNEAWRPMRLNKNTNYGYKNCVKYIKNLKSREELLELGKEIDEQRRFLHFKTSTTNKTL